MNWFTNLFVPKEKPDWRLCGQFEASYLIKYKDDYGRPKPDETKRGCIKTFFLYEDQNGNRKFEIVDSEYGDMDIKKLPRDDYSYRCITYRDKVRPWLDGRYDPDISDYETIPQNDFHNRLAKKKVK